MAAEAQHVIALSLNKIVASRGRRGGVSLRRNLLVASVLLRAKDVYLAGRHALSLNEGLKGDARDTDTRDAWEAEKDAEESRDHEESTGNAGAVRDEKSTTVAEATCDGVPIMDAKHKSEEESCLNAEPVKDGGARMVNMELTGDAEVTTPNMEYEMESNNVEMLNSDPRGCRAIASNLSGLYEVEQCKENIDPSSPPCSVDTNTACAGQCVTSLRKRHYTELERAVASIGGKQDSPDCVVAGCEGAGCEGQECEGTEYGSPCKAGIATQYSGVKNVTDCSDDKPSRKHARLDAVGDTRPCDTRLISLHINEVNTSRASVKTVDYSSLSNTRGWNGSCAERSAVSTGGDWVVLQGTCRRAASEPHLTLTASLPARRVVT